MAVSSLRSRFLKRLPDVLEQGDYVLLKLVVSALEDLPVGSDVDVLASRERAGEFRRVFQSDHSVERMSCTPKSAMTVFRLFFRDGGVLQIDVLHRFVRKELVYLDEREVLSSWMRDPRSGLRVPKPAVRFEHCFLFALLNGASVSPKHIEWVRGLPLRERDGIAGSMRNRFGLEVESLSELLVYRADFRRRVEKVLLQRRANSVARRAGRIRACFSDAWISRGRIMSFSGVDGSGKSTILEDVASRLRQEHRVPVVLKRHRPGMVPILSAWRHGAREAERRSMERLPRTGTNYSKVSSLLRFLYYFADYAVGQNVVFVAHTLRGRWVLYDRYYFDFMADPRRSNIELSSSWGRFFFRFIMEPDINVFLSVPPKVARMRKQELSSEAIHELNESYRALFTCLSGRRRGGEYLVIENIDREPTVNRVLALVRRRL